jgi:hypothetical protein
VDLKLYLRVLWRFRLLVGIGFVVACGLSFLSIVRVDPSHSPHFRYRQDQQWVSYATLFVTQRGFPWGRSVIPSAATSTYPSAASSSDQQYADPSRFSSLAILYSQFATSDPVRQIMLRDGPIDGTIEAAPVLSQTGYTEALPLVSIAGIGKSPKDAISLANRTMVALEQFLEQQQIRNKIPEQSRVLVTVVNHPVKAKLLAGRSMTVPIVVFLSVMIVISGIAFLLENLRPRIRPVAADVVVPETAARRTA